MTVAGISWTCSLGRPNTDVSARLNSVASILDADEPDNDGNSQHSNVWSILRQTLISIAKGALHEVDPTKLTGFLSELPFTLQYQHVPSGSPFVLALTNLHQTDKPETAASGLLLDLLAASADEAFQLRRCFYDGAWFSPGLRTARSKFCSARCRNRFNYELRSQGASFVCTECERIFSLDGFSGLARERGTIEPADFHAPEPLCTICVEAQNPDWNAYLVSAELAPSNSGSLKSGESYSSEINELISAALALSKTPMHLRSIADFVAAKRAVKGRSPELTILGYLLRSPQRFTQVTRDTFTLTPRAKSMELKESRSAR